MESSRMIKTQGIILCETITMCKQILMDKFLKRRNLKKKQVQSDIDDIIINSLWVI